MKQFLPMTAGILLALGLGVTQPAHAFPLVFCGGAAPISGANCCTAICGGITLQTPCAGAFFHGTTSGCCPTIGISQFGGHAAITLTGGGAFSLTSIQMGEANCSGPGLVDFSGSNGANISFCVNTPNLTTFDFGCTFDDVTSVTFDANQGIPTDGPFASEGQIVVGAATAPEVDPTLMLGTLLGLASLRKSKLTSRQ